jgi:hypothetical protein
MAIEFFRSPKKAWEEGHEMAIRTRGVGGKKRVEKRGKKDNENKGKILARLSRRKKG